MQRDYGARSCREIMHTLSVFNKLTSFLSLIFALPPPIFVPLPQTPPPSIARTQSLYSTLTEVSLDQRARGVLRGLDSWMWKFRVVLARNFANYYRNPGNVRRGGGADGGDDGGVQANRQEDR